MNSLTPSLTCSAGRSNSAATRSASCSRDIFWGREVPRSYKKGLAFSQTAAIGNLGIADCTGRSTGVCKPSKDGGLKNWMATTTRRTAKDKSFAVMKPDFLQMLEHSVDVVHGQDNGVGEAASKEGGRWVSRPANAAI